ncbi:MAG TPA: cation diffusion facilitator family transporter [Myxococcaceae bacterium]|nr:cation diffusion facilitator family transporter [Myxococcaceae bacterium]
MSSTCFEPCRPGDVEDAPENAGSVAAPSSRLSPVHAHGGHAHPHDHGGDVHAHGHSHGPGGHGAQRRADRRRLWIALLISGSIALVEAVGGWMSGSLALLSDAGHMLGDVSALGLSLFALWIAGKPADAKRTYGYYRMEILSALANGVLLLGVTVYILYEAWQRLQSPAEVQLGLMASVAVVGLVANLLSLWVLGHSHSHNVRGAFLHVLGDTLSSVGVLIAAGVIALTGWTPIDAILSAVIAVVIVVSALRLVRESVDVLLEAVPPHVDMGKVRGILGEIDGVIAVHDLHVWTISSGIYALSAHLVVTDPRACDNDAILTEARKRLIEVCGVDHTTIQIEGERFAHAGDVH